MPSSNIPRLLLIAPAVLVGLMLLAFTPSAGASSALDQYVEQVPDPGGDKPPQPEPNVPPTPAPDPHKTGKGSGNGSEASAPSTPIATEPGHAVPSGVSPEAGPTRGARKASPRDTGDQRADSKDAQGRVLDGHEEPDRVAAWSQAAEASGVNAPLAVFVALTAVAMVGFAVRRKLRGESR